MKSSQNIRTIASGNACRNKSPIVKSFTRAAKVKDDPWWVNKEVADLWRSEYKPKFPDWYSIYAKQRHAQKSSDLVRKKYNELPKDHPWKLKRICRVRINDAIKSYNGNAKFRRENRAHHLIGCNIDQLRSHLEKQFKRGMTWSNHGTLWHIDHIIPCAAFDLTRPNQILQCFHYSNMQPLWAADNIRKSDKITQTHQMQFL